MVSSDSGLREMGQNNVPVLPILRHKKAVLKTLANIARAKSAKNLALKKNRPG